MTEIIAKGLFVLSFCVPPAAVMVGLIVLGTRNVKVQPPVAKPSDLSSAA